MNNSKVTNSLTSHRGERSSHRVDKMSGDFNKFDEWRGSTKKFYKKFTNKKRRQLLKQNKENKI